MEKDKKTSTVILSNMCMVYDENGNILVQNRTKSDWPGITFPGGHVEINETLEEAVIREIKEETGLDIKNPILCGIKERPWGDGVRYIGLLYKTNEFSGSLKESEEGEVFWIKEKDFFKYKLSLDFDEMYKIIKNR